MKKNKKSFVMPEERIEEEVRRYNQSICPTIDDVAEDETEEIRNQLKFFMTQAFEIGVRMTTKTILGTIKTSVEELYKTNEANIEKLKKDIENDVECRHPNNGVRLIQLDGANSFIEALIDSLDLDDVPYEIKGAEGEAVFPYATKKLVQEKLGYSIDEHMKIQAVNKSGGVVS